MGPARWSSHLYAPYLQTMLRESLEHVTTEEGREPTKRCIAVLGVVGYGLADLWSGYRAPGDAGKLP